MTTKSLLRLAVLFVLSFGLAHAQATTGTIEGRVLNSGTGEYLENARVTVEGTALEAFTDSLGQFRFANVPAGAAKVRVFFTGLQSETATVNVGAGQTATRDF